MRVSGTTASWENGWNLVRNSDDGILHADRNSHRWSVQSGWRTTMNIIVIWMHQYLSYNGLHKNTRMRQDEYEFTLFLAPQELFHQISTFEYDKQNYLQTNIIWGKPTFLSRQISIDVNVGNNSSISLPWRLVESCSCGVLHRILCNTIPEHVWLSLWPCDRHERHLRAKHSI